ncbi:MAG: PhoH family protein, partial [Alcanivoracaceae bacterium]|nr:PhoH family protein [Alcanivoracaceae bacterium]
VNNLAGVPSVVYGVFGLGFFVYFLGGNIDALFFPEAGPAPTFGTPGILWSSLTLAILTLPVVIVATEEGLSRIPLAIREGSLALGATKAETLWRIVIPMASPALMTGLILAVARAAGEVAPLAFMRGRTLNNAFVILDEAQNTTVEQMKMFLTRTGFDSTVVVTGDVTQVDLSKGQTSGLKHAIEVLGDVSGLSFSWFESKDVVRHNLVQKIINAYEACG